MTEVGVPGASPNRDPVQILFGSVGCNVPSAGEAVCNLLRRTNAKPRFAKSASLGIMPSHASREKMPGLSLSAPALAFDHLGICSGNGCIHGGDVEVQLQVLVLLKAD